MEERKRERERERERAVRENMTAVFI